MQANIIVPIPMNNTFGTKTPASCIGCGRNRSPMVLVKAVKSAGQPDKHFPKNNIVSRWIRKPFRAPDGLDRYNVCWVVRFLGDTDTTKPVYFSNAVYNFQKKATDDKIGRTMVYINSHVCVDFNLDFVGDHDSYPFRKRIIVFSSERQARQVHQHLIETFEDDRFRVEDVALSKIVDACKTSSIDVQLVYKSGESKIYSALNDCGIEFRDALKKVNEM